VPQLTNLDIVRRLLNQDRYWAAYAIGDLAPGFIEHCEWRVHDGDSTALLLIYRGYTPPIVFAMGTADALRPLFGELAEPEISLHVRPEALAPLSAHYSPLQTRTMLRMTVTAMSFRPAADADASDSARGQPVTRLSEENIGAVEALYADGRQRGDGPTFFYREMLRQGTFHGIWESDALISIAGTHLYSRELGVCAIGNVYTRGDRRGRGLAARVTSAVVAQSLDEGVETIVLNVGEENVAAQRVYERLGFTIYGPFLEGEATRRTHVATSIA
jgi:RimJ/RimL family protein N-acetyltransferase